MKKYYSLLFTLITLHVFGQTPWKPQGMGLLPTKYGMSDIAAIDKDTVWALATAGNLNGIPDTAIIMRSTDGGENWYVRALDEFAGRNVLFLTALNKDIAWISMTDPVQKATYIYKTVDGAANWTEQLYIPQGNPEQLWAPAVRFVDAERGFYVDATTNISGKTTDGGMSWDTTAMPDWVQNEWWGIISSQNWLEAVGDTIWWGTSKRILRSIDGGNNWEEFFPNFPGNNLITSVAFNSDGLGLAISDGDLDLPFIPSFLSETVIVQSKDFGENWTVLSENAPFPLTVITDVPGSPNTFFAVSGVWTWLYPSIQLSWASAYTMDGGESWTAIDRDIPYHAIDFVSPSTGWIGRIGDYDYGPDNPAIFKWSGTISSNSLQSDEIDFTVLPNPFSSQIHFKDPKVTDGIQRVELITSDGVVLQGLDAKDLASKDFSNLPAGTYYLKIVTLKGTVFKKVIKI